MEAPAGSAPEPCSWPPGTAPTPGASPAPHVQFQFQVHVATPVGGAALAACPGSHPGAPVQVQFQIHVVGAGVEPLGAGGDRAATSGGLRHRRVVARAEDPDGDVDVARGRVRHGGSEGRRRDDRRHVDRELVRHVGGQVVRLRVRARGRVVGGVRRLRGSGLGLGDRGLGDDGQLGSRRTIFRHTFTVTSCIFRVILRRRGRLRRGRRRGGRRNDRRRRLDRGRRSGHGVDGGGHVGHLILR